MEKEIIIINRWNWKKLSGNSCIKLNNLFIDRFADRWDWNELINSRYNGDELYTREFFDRYRKHIPMQAFLDDSFLLRELQSKEVERLKRNSQVISNKLTY